MNAGPEPGSPLPAPPGGPARRRRPRWWLRALAVAGCLVAVLAVLAGIGREVQQQERRRSVPAATRFDLPPALDGLVRQDDYQVKSLAQALQQSKQLFGGTPFTVSSAGYAGRDIVILIGVAKPSRPLTQPEQDRIAAERRQSLLARGGSVTPAPGPLGGSIVCGRTEPICTVVDQGGFVLFLAPRGGDLSSRVPAIRAQIEHRG